METLEDQEMKGKVEVMRNLQEVILELKVHSVGLQPAHLQDKHFA